MKSFLPILAMVCTVLVTLTMVVMCAAMGANSSPAEIRALKLWMAGFGVLGGAGVMVGIFLMRGGQHNWAAGAAFLPTVIMAVVAIVALLK